MAVLIKATDTNMLTEDDNMNLLRNKKKDVPKVYCKTCTATCPVCKKEHTADVCIDAQRYLDGSPIMTIEQCLSRFVVCDSCGYIFNMEYPSAGWLEGRQQEYQRATTQIYENQNIRKLMLLDALSTREYKGWMWLRYYQDIQDNEKARLVMNEMLTRPYEFDPKLGNDSFVAVRLPHLCFFRTELRDIDFLRQLGRFDEAQEKALYCLRNLEQLHLTAFEDYLKTELRLIRKRDTTLQ
jgi:hypothetical protein